jgi:shikimate kinase
MGQVVTLIGFMGSGKSTAGRRAAELLGCHFVDLDDDIERREGMTVPQIFRLGGESAFRLSELRALEAAYSEAWREDCLVIAVGGGAPTIPETRRAIRAAGSVIFLDVPPEEAWRRTQGTDRPLAQDVDSFRVLYEDRQPIYEELADDVIETGEASADKVAERVAESARRLFRRPATDNTGEVAFPAGSRRPT